MALLRRTLLILILISLIGCAFSWRSEADGDANYAAARPPHGDWLAKNRETVIAEIVRAVRERHPSTASDFPSLSLNSLTIESMRESDQWPAVKTELGAILGAVSAAVTPESENSERWQVDVSIGFLYQTPDDDGPNPAEIVAAAGYGMFCWYSFLIVCPMGGEGSVVTTTWQVQPPTGDPLRFTALGASRYLASTPWLADDPQFLDPAMAKALAAAIANFADQFVEEVTPKLFTK